MRRIDSGYGIAKLASALADATRAHVCAVLMDGCAWTVSELATETGVSPQAMTSCVTKLEEAHLITRVRQGRHSYVKLSSASTAHIIEFMGAATEPEAARVTGFRQVRADRRLRYARTCYNHIAGHLAILITTAMDRRGFIELRDDSMRLTDEGMRWFWNNGVTEAQLRKPPQVKACLDWTERRMHIGGSAGSALCSRLLELNVVHRHTPRRALQVTDTGRAWFASELGISEDALSEDALNAVP